MLGSGDYGTGNQGADRFEVGDWVEAGNHARIIDYDPAEDRIEVRYDAKDHPEPKLTVEDDEATGEARVLLDGKPLVAVQNGLGLKAADILLTAI